MAMAENHPSRSNLESGHLGGGCQAFDCHVGQSCGGTSDRLLIGPAASLAVEGAVLFQTGGGPIGCWLLRGRTPGGLRGPTGCGMGGPGAKMWPESANVARVRPTFSRFGPRCVSKVGQCWSSLASSPRKLHPKCLREDFSSIFQASFQVLSHTPSRGHQFREHVSSIRSRRAPRGAGIPATHTACGDSLPAPGPKHGEVFRSEAEGVPAIRPHRHVRTIAEDVHLFTECRRIWSNLAEFDQHWPMLAHVSRIMADFGRTLAEIGQCQPNIDRNRPKFGLDWPT